MRALAVPSNPVRAFALGNTLEEMGRGLRVLKRSFSNQGVSSLRQAAPPPDLIRPRPPKAPSIFFRAHRSFCDKGQLTAFRWLSRVHPGFHGSNAGYPGAWACC